MHVTESRPIHRNAPAAIAARQWFVLLPAIVGSLAGLGWSLRTAPIYEASVGVVVSPIPGSDPMAPASPAEAMRLADRVINSPEVRDAARRDVESIADPPVVRFSISPDEVTGRLAVRDGDPDAAMRMVNAYADAAGTAMRSSAGLSLATVGPPSRPVDPIGPSPARDVGLGLVAGLALGVAAALIRDVRDDGVRPGVDIEGITGLPLLGEIPRLRPVEDGRPIPSRANRSDDTFRALATSIGRLGGDRRLRVIQVVAPGVGDGASTVAAGLAIASSIAGRDIVLVDGDVRAPGQHETLRLPLKPGLLSVVSKISSSVMVHPINRRLEVVTAGGTTPAPAEFLASHAVGELLDFLSEDGELVILDSHALFPRRDALGALRHVDGVVIVARSGKTSVKALTATIEAITRAGGRPLGVVLNRVGRRSYRGARHRRSEHPPAFDADAIDVGPSRERSPIERRRERAAAAQPTCPTGPPSPHPATFDLPPGATPAPLAGPNGESDAFVPSVDGAIGPANGVRPPAAAPGPVPAGSDGGFRRRGTRSPGAPVGAASSAADFASGRTPADAAGSFTPRFGVGERWADIIAHVA